MVHSYLNSKFNIFSIYFFFVGMVTVDPGILKHISDISCKSKGWKSAWENTKTVQSYIFLQSHLDSI